MHVFLYMKKVLTSLCLLRFENHFWDLVYTFKNMYINTFFLNNLRPILKKQIPNIFAPIKFKSFPVIAWKPLSLGLGLGWVWVFCKSLANIINNLIYK